MENSKIHQKSPPKKLNESSDIAIFQISTLGINYSSESDSWSSHADMLLHVFPRHSVQATEHSRPCFLQLQRFESQFVLHLKYIVFRSSSGAGGKLDLIGTHMLCSIDHPQSFASILSASPIHFFTWWNTRKIWKFAAFDVGSKNDAINYRGITVLPVISKIVEAVIREYNHWSIICKILRKEGLRKDRPPWMLLYLSKKHTEY